MALEVGRLEPSYLQRETPITEEGVEQMLELAERLRAENGGVLDDSAIQAVAEATGAPSEYVRLAVKLRTEKVKTSFLRTARSQYLQLEPNVRRYVASGAAAVFFALFFALGMRFDSGDHSYGIFDMIGLVALTVGAYNVSISKDGRVAAVCGAELGGGFVVLFSVFALLLRTEGYGSAGVWLLIPVTALGAIAGVVLQRTVAKYRDRLGLKDPAKERQELLRQLVSLQDQLRSNEQQVTFLSLDIVGSTKMKQLSDPLSVEFTFTEYHQFVERITRKWGGSMHSTAGDGITCAFETPAQAFSAARNIQTGIIELNTFRNKIGIPIVLRAGVHTGTVVTPQAGDIKSVNFAHVIDIAAHLQKVCPPGGIAVSESAAAMVPGGVAAIGVTRVSVSDVNAVVWDPRPGTPPVGAVGMPPRPSVPEST